MKWCSKCGDEKPDEQFSPQREMRCGLSSWCRGCKAEKEARRRRSLGVAARSTPAVADPTKKECLGCLDVFQLSKFPKSVRGRMGRSSYCRVCTRRYHRQEKFREKRRLATRRYRERNRDWWLFLHRCYMQKRRAIKRGLDTGLVTRDVLAAIYAAEECHYCGNPTPRERRTCDHVRPLNKGGTHHPDNLVMACSSCNSAKQDRDAEEFVNDSGRSAG